MSEIGKLLAMQIEQPLERATVEYKDGDDFWYNPTPGQPVVSGVAVTPDLAMQATTINACVRLIAGTTAKLPFPLMKRVDDKTRERASEHHVHYLLNHRPNRWQTAFEFRRMLTAHVAKRGNAYAQILRGPRHFADQLIPLHPDAVTPEQQDDYSIHYKIATKRGPRTLFQDEVFHLRDLTEDGVEGISRLEQAREAIGLALAAQVYGAAYFGNGADASIGLFSEKGVTLDKAARARILESWKSSRGGPYNAHTPFVGEGGLRPERLGLTNKDSQFLELRGFQVIDLARLYGVPPHLIGAQESTTSWGTGVEQLTLGFVKFTLLDWLTMWETAVARDLLLDGEFGTYYARHNVDGLLRGDFKSRMEGFGMAIDRGVYNPDEVRAKLDENPREDGRGGEYVRAANMAPASHDPPPTGASAFSPAEEELVLQAARTIEARRAA